MANETEFWEAIRQIREKDNRFEPEAYPFIMEALEYTLQRIGERRHVSADELIDGLCTYCRGRYGLLSGDVLAEWGIENAFDVGLVVFQLIEAGILAKQDSDHLADFEESLDLRNMLEHGYFD